MEAEHGLAFLNQLLFTALTVAVVRQAALSRARTDVDAALLFGTTTCITVESWVLEALQLKPGRVAGALAVALLMALPYLLLRLVRDFSDVSVGLMRSAGLGLALCVAGMLVWPPDGVPGAAVLFYLVYFVGLILHAAVVFRREAMRAAGVTRRRLLAVAWGSACLATVILLAGVQSALPQPSTPVMFLSQLLGTGCCVGYFLGFTPPAWLRHAWQMPELRDFFAIAVKAPAAQTLDAMLLALERGAAATVGADKGAIGLFNPENGMLRYSHPESPGGFRDVRPAEDQAGRAFLTQTATHWTHLPAAGLKSTPDVRPERLHAVLATPIRVGQEMLGVLSVHASRAPIFAADDLATIQLLSDQVAMAIQARRLMDAAAAVKARADTARMKDEFLSVAAHDLKSPVTVVLTQAQALQRWLARHPGEAPNAVEVDRIVRGALRLKRLVTELLDAALLERGALASARTTCDLAAVVLEAAGELTLDHPQVTVDAPAPVLAVVDQLRTRQVVANLLENAVKYSPKGGRVVVRVWEELGRAKVSVSDQGMGIPPEDLGRVFERFHRASNAKDSGFSGLGLGLYICRGIVEQQGGTIAAASTLGEGTVMCVDLPVAPAGDAS